jgi:hygromycin-B 7''-O-kinase
MATDFLPVADTEERFAAVRRDESRLRPGVSALCRRLGLGGVAATRFPGGSLPVYAAGERLVCAPSAGACRWPRRAWSTPARTATGGTSS